MKIIDGKEISNQIKLEIKKEVDLIISKGQRPPHLAAVIVGEDGASLTYVGSKVRSCNQVGFESTLIKLDSSISEDKLIDQINLLNNDKEIDGFIVQLPLPKHINEENILIADSPKEFYGQALKINSGKTDYKKIGENAREHVLKTYDQNKISKKLVSDILEMSL